MSAVFPETLTDAPPKKSIDKVRKRSRSSFIRLSRGRAVRRAVSIRTPLAALGSERRSIEAGGVVDSRA